MSRTRVKICGITRLEDAEAAVQAGADAVGLVCVPASPRFIAGEQAAMIARRLPPFVASVLLFMDAPASFVREQIDRVAPSLLQFHGAETPSYCAQFARPYLKSVAMGAEQDLAQLAERYRDAAALLLDAHAPGEMGGSGQRFDWQAARAAPCRIVLAGGLRPDNVGAAIRTARPYAVDVSSGVEVVPGRKDPTLIQRFIDEVRKADA